MGGIALITNGYLEFGIILYSLSYNLNIISLWTFPLVLVYMTFFFVKESIKEGMFTHKLRFVEVN